MAHWGSFTELLASFSVPLQETAERFEYAANHHVDVRSCAEGSNVEGDNNTGSLPVYATFHEDLPPFVYESPFSGSGDGHTSSSMGEEFRSAGIDLDWSDTGLEEDPDADCLFSDSDSGSDDEAEIPVGDTDNVDLRGDDNPRSENPDGVEHRTAEASYERHAPEATPYERRKRHPKDAVLPEFRPSRSMGAVEIALRRAAGNPPEHIFLPTAGMVFDSCTEAYEFYNLYSWEVGFGIRYGNSYRNHKNKYQTMQQFECTNAGDDPRCKTQSQRCQCPARLRLLRTGDHGWYVRKIVVEHNHPLSKNHGEKMQWHSHRHIDQSTRDMVKYLRDNNVSLTKVHGFLGSMFGSVEELPFTKRSLRTVCADIARASMEDDVSKTMQLFHKMKAEDPHFSFSVDVDGNNRVKTMMWSNNRSKAQYSCFGDVFTFDTTYCTNIYKMPFGLFVGVNNHFQSVIFGGVLMRDEKTESFQWVFRQFISMMGGKPPVTILTDQCAAMKAALEIELPETTHLWCKWHVLRKAQESLGPVYTRDKVFRQKFYKAINEMLTVDEFERAWDELIGEYDLRENPFMVRTYEARHMWAKPYSKDKFCARMMSTQRGESANHMLKVHVPRNSPMNRFVEQYNNLLYDRAVEEDREEHLTKQVRKKAKHMWPVQYHAYKLYTRATYKLFCREIGKASHYIVSNLPEDGLFEIKHAYPAKRERWARVVFRVSVVAGGQSYTCECGLYNHFGILCCHVIRLMIHLGVDTIPEAHILKRWTRDALDVLPPHLAMYQKDNKAVQSRTFRHRVLLTNFLEMADVGNTNMEAFEVMMKHMKAANVEVRPILAAAAAEAESDLDHGYESSDVEWRRQGSAGYQSEPELPSRTRHGASGGVADFGVDELMNIRPPLVRKTAGRPRTNRFKSPVEQPVRKAPNKKGPSVPRNNQRKRGAPQTSFCSVCRGSGHNKTTCPENNDQGNNTRKKRRCSTCQLPGHTSSSCLTKTPTAGEFDYF